MAEADVLGALARGSQEDLRRRRVRILLEEVVLDLEHVVKAKLVRQLDLVERVLQDLVLVFDIPVVLVVRPRQLVLVEQSEFHHITSSLSTEHRGAPTCADAARRGGPTWPPLSDPTANPTTRHRPPVTP